MFQLYPYQNNIVTGIRQAYTNKYNAPLVVSPTGSGKTVIYTHVSQGAVTKDNRVLILTHRYELLKQTSAALMENQVFHGLINPKFKENQLAPIQVGTVQTVLNRLGGINRNFKLIVIDEAHHAVADSWREVIGSMPDAKLLGVTATPVRTDGRGLGRASGGLFDVMVHGPQIGQLINDGYLKKYRVYGPRNTLDLSGIKKVRGEFHEAELEARLNKRTITGDALHEYNRICPGLPTIVFCTSVKHAEDVALEFRTAGWNFLPIHGNLSEKERTRLIKGLADGSIHGLTSCDLISEGTDVPAVCVAICLRPTMSTGLWIQMCGRPGRKYPGQEYAYILDHANNVYRHGLPDEDREWSLDTDYIYQPNTGGEENRSKVIQCKNCNALVMRAARCPQCGVGMIISKPLIVVNGQLQEIKPEEFNRIVSAGATELPKDVKPLEYFQEIAKGKQYKQGWAHYMYKAQFKKKRA